MADAERKLNNGKSRIDFQTDPSKYRHWKLEVDGDVATLLMDVDEKGALFEGYELKLNSYDLGVDIELADANIRMLAGATHAHKVNFCKFTNETRNGLEDASEASGLSTICVINGTAAGGGYELALAADHIMLIDDGSSAVSLPELPLLAVLPGTGGPHPGTRQTQGAPQPPRGVCTTRAGRKRQRPRGAPDTREEGSSARAALASEASGQRGHFKSARAGHSPEPGSSARARLATLTLRGPQAAPPASAEAMVEQGAEFWPLKLARELDDAILDIRANEFDVAAIVFKSSGLPAQVLAYDQFLDANKEHWLAREIRGLWKRVLKRIDLTSRSLVALVEPGSCFAGTLAELVFASDRSYMLIGKRDGDNKPPATLALATVNFGAYPMSNGLSRLASRFLADPTDLDPAKAAAGEALAPEAAERLGLVTFALDDIHWEDQIPVFLQH